MNVIATVVDNLISEPCSCDIEDMCRRSVAMEIKAGRRLLSSDEVDDVVEDVVEEETAVDVEDHVDGDFIRMSDIEWKSVSSSKKVTYGSEVGCVVNGSFLPVRTYPDPRPSMYADRISKIIEGAANMANISDGVNIKSLYHPVPAINVSCPKCASRNITPVWFDDGRVTACCNECFAEFDASIDDVDDATLADRTVEDVDIIPEQEMFGSVWYAGDGVYGYEIYSFGELVDSGEAASFSEIQDRFDDVADAYDALEENVVVDFATGDSEEINDVSDSHLGFAGGRSASRAKVARMVADGQAFIDVSKVSSLDFRAGDVFRKRDGSMVSVDRVSRGSVLATVTRPMSNGSVSRFEVSASPFEFERIISR